MIDRPPHRGTPSKGVPYRGIDYPSLRSATIGSTRVARRAGTYDANAATRPNPSRTAAKVRASSVPSLSDSSSTSAIVTPGRSAGVDHRAADEI